MIGPQGVSTCTSVAVSVAVKPMAPCRVSPKCQGRRGDLHRPAVGDAQDQLTSSGRPEGMTDDSYTCPKPGYSLV